MRQHRTMALAWAVALDIQDSGGDVSYTDVSGEVEVPEDSLFQTP